LYFSLSQWRRLAVANQRGRSASSAPSTPSTHQAQSKCFSSLRLDARLFLSFCIPSLRKRTCSLPASWLICIFCHRTTIAWLAATSSPAIDALALLLFLPFKSPQTVSFPQLRARLQQHPISFFIFHLFQTSSTLACMWLIYLPGSRALHPISIASIAKDRVVVSRDPQLAPSV
jgi:hypothetical protein